MDLRISLFNVALSCGTADVSTMVVVTFSGVPILGGIVICGRTDWILLVTNVSFTRLVMRLDLPVPSSPHRQMRTIKEVSSMILERGRILSCRRYLLTFRGERALIWSLDRLRLIQNAWIISIEACRHLTSEATEGLATQDSSTRFMH